MGNAPRSAMLGMWFFSSRYLRSLTNGLSIIYGGMVPL